MWLETMEATESMPLAEREPPAAVLAWLKKNLTASVARFEGAITGAAAAAAGGMPALAAPAEVAEAAEAGAKKKGKKKGAKAARDATTREYKEAAAAEGAPPEMAVAPAVSAAFLRVPGLPPMVAAAEGTQAGQGGPAEGATRRGASPKRPIDLVAHSTGSAEVGAELGAVEARQDGDGATAARAAKRAKDTRGAASMEPAPAPEPQQQPQQQPKAAVPMEADADLADADLEEPRWVDASLVEEVPASRPAAAPTATLTAPSAAPAAAPAHAAAPAPAAHAAAPAPAGRGEGARLLQSLGRFAPIVDAPPGGGRSTRRSASTASVTAPPTAASALEKELPNMELPRPEEAAKAKEQVQPPAAAAPKAAPKAKKGDKAATAATAATAAPAAPAADPSAAVISVGDIFTVSGLTQHIDRNGKKARVVGYDAKKGLWHVMIEGESSKVALRKENLVSDAASTDATTATDAAASTSEREAELKWLAEKQAERDARAARLAKAAPHPIVEHAPKRSRKHAVMAPSEMDEAGAAAMEVDAPAAPAPPAAPAAEATPNGGRRTSSRLSSRASLSPLVGVAAGAVAGAWRASIGALGANARGASVRASLVGVPEERGDTAIDTEAQVERFHPSSAPRRRATASRTSVATASTPAPEMALVAAIKAAKPGDKYSLQEEEDDEDDEEAQVAALAAPRSKRPAAQKGGAAPPPSKVAKGADMETAPKAAAAAKAAAQAAMADGAPNMAPTAKGACRGAVKAAVKAYVEVDEEVFVDVPLDDDDDDDGDASENGGPNRPAIKAAIKAATKAAGKGKGKSAANPKGKAKPATPDGSSDSPRQPLAQHGAQSLAQHGAQQPEQPDGGAKGRKRALLSKKFRPSSAFVPFMVDASAVPLHSP